MRFDVISIVYIVIVLIMLLIGLKRGFFSMLISMFKGIIAGFVAAFLSKPVGSLLFKTGLGTKLSGSLAETFLAKGGTLAAEIPEGIDEATKVEYINKGLSELKIPSFLNGFFNKLFNSSGVVFEGKVADVFAHAISIYIFIVIGFFVVFLIAMILLIIFGKIFESIQQIPIIGTLNKILGMALGALYGLFIVCLISYAITWSMQLIPSLGNTFASWMYLDSPDVKTISKFFYQQNFIVKIIAAVQGLFTK